MPERSKVSDCTACYRAQTARESRRVDGEMIMAGGGFMSAGRPATSIISACCNDFRAIQRYIGIASARRKIATGCRRLAKGDRNRQAEAGLAPRRSSGFFGQDLLLESASSSAFKT
jgi:hypothetical protein